MSQALYRKYRPQQWKEIAGQNHIKVTLQNELANEKTAHAFLFCGPRGTGKTTTARLLAKSLNCENRKKGESEPCGKCDACKELVEGRDLDLIEIDAASHTGVDNVRENIIEHSRFTPNKRTYKVFIIDEVHMLSIAAFNALLKILEEPPKHVIFILATTEIHKVPVTIISRCQRFDFHKIPKEELLTRLLRICTEEEVHVSDDVLNAIIAQSDGCLRDAESLLAQVLSLGDKNIDMDQAELILPRSYAQEVFELLTFVFNRNIHQALEYINTLMDEGIDIQHFTDGCISVLRKIMLIKTSGSLTTHAGDYSQDLEKKAVSIAEKQEASNILELLEAFIQAKEYIKQSQLPQLPIEMLIVDYCTTPSAQPAIVKEAQTTEAPVEKTQPQKSVKKNNTPEEKKKTSSITLEVIRKDWNKLLDHLQQLNPSLVLILKVSEPMNLDGDTLTLGVKFDFHQKKLEQTKVRESIEKSLCAVYNDNLLLKTQVFEPGYVSEFIEKQVESDEVEFVDEVKPGEGETPEDAVQKLAEAFGGTVVG